MGTHVKLTRTWIQFNIALFSAYSFFGVLSLFWPTPLARLWLYPLHMGGLALNLAILYGLARKTSWAVYLVLFMSLSMVLHLLVFIFAPLSMMLAYIGPSRSFYSMFISSIAYFGMGDSFVLLNNIFNSAMVLAHLANFLFFLRSETLDVFSPAHVHTHAHA